MAMAGETCDKKYISYARCFYHGVWRVWLYGDSPHETVRENTTRADRSDLLLHPVLYTLIMPNYNVNASTSIDYYY